MEFSSPNLRRTVNLGRKREEINQHHVQKMGIHKIKHKNPSKHKPAYWLVDQYFIMGTLQKEMNTILRSLSLTGFILCLINSDFEIEIA